MNAGLFISVEGIHGSGKTTCIAHMVSRFSDAGITAVATNGQSGTSIGQKLRELHLTDCELQPDPWTEAWLIAAAGRQNVVEVVAPALCIGKTVISERYGDALLAFQGYGRRLDMVFLKALQDKIEGGIVPDVTLLLDAPVAIALARIQSEPMHRIEKESVVFHEAVRNGYLAIAADNAPRIVVIDATRSIAQVADSAWQQVQSRLQQESH